jgi:addiction module RelE/StbE family toxin
MEIEWSFRARTDIQELHAYISKDSPYYARQFVERILGAVDILRSHPQIGRILPEANRENMRELLVNNYRIIYLLKPNQVFIVTVIHGSRDLAKEIFSL